MSGADLGHKPRFDPAYDLEFRCCGETYLVRRSLDLAKRVEQRFGPIATLCQRLATADIRQADLATLYLTLLDGDRDAPVRRHIEQWLFNDAGTHGPATELYGQVMSLIMSAEMLARAHREQTERAAASDGSEVPVDAPFGQTTASTGAGGSSWADALASIRQASGRPAFTT